MNFKRLKTNMGVTLTELMVSLAIVGLLVSIVGTFLMGGIRFYRLTTAKGEIQRDVRNAIDVINRNIRQAEAQSVVISRYWGPIRATPSSST